MSGLTNTAISTTGGYLDHVIKAGILEVVDGIAINMLLNFVNNKFFSKLPEEDCIIISDALVNIFDDNVVTIDELEEETANISTIIAKYVNTPMVDNTPEEMALIEGVLMIIIKSAEVLIAKMKAKEVE